MRITMLEKKVKSPKSKDMVLLDNLHWAMYIEPANDEHKPILIFLTNYGYDVIINSYRDSDFILKFELEEGVSYKVTRVIPHEQIEIREI